MSDLQKMEEETKEKIAAVNLQKVAIVSAFVASMKVWINELGTKGLHCIPCFSYPNIPSCYM